MTIPVKNKKIGRPKVVFTDKQIKEVGELAKRLSVTQIADYMGITEETFLAIRKRQPEVSVSYKKGKGRAIDFVASCLMDKIESGDTSSIIFYLKTQAGWSEKQLLDVTSNVEVDLPNIVLKTNSK